MWRSYFTDKKWMFWCYGGGALILSLIVFQTWLSVQFNTWYGTFYDLLQKPPETGGLEKFYESENLAQVLCIEGVSAFGFSGMEIETICRYKLPVFVVVFNNSGIYRGTDVNPSGGDDVATTVFVKDARYDKMIEAFGGLGFIATSPDELKRAVNEAMDAGRPALVNAVIDEQAGTESGRIGNLNPQSVVAKK